MQPGLPRDQFSAPWLISTAEARTSNSSSSSPCKRASKRTNALGIERARSIIVLSRDRAPQSAQSWGLGPPPSTCAHDHVLAFLVSPPPKMRKRRFFGEKGAYRELASSLDTASERERGGSQPFGAFGCVRQYSAYPGACGYIQGASSGHNSRDTDFSVRYLRRVVALLLLVVVVLVLVRRGSIAVIAVDALALLGRRTRARGPR